MASLPAISPAATPISDSPITPARRKPGQASRRRTPAEHADYLAALVERYPVASIEAPMAEDDHTGWRDLTARLGERCQITGYDVLCTNEILLRAGIRDGIAISILVKVNQTGTLTETFATVATAHRAGYTVVMSHRPGETEDTTIAALAVATGCGQIKTGSLRADRPTAAG